ncbi:GtrA family protein [Paraburkholderia sp. RP-4-7]|uniref:GtrA family protein n=1 Tax=Paraburkholderia polaris TaxID=2728848 RepID=A0A848IF62_9BURK|nr:GtrA family protein [Paraburkholderia polaris]NMM00862.1 GtrA family protein [Paraburkholderia polaris]
MNRAERIKVLRFGVSGLLATGLHAAVAMTLIMRAGTQPALANALAFACSTGISYLMNTFWSFSSFPALANVWRFATVSLGGLTLTALVAHATELAGGGPGLGIAMVVCVVPPVTFIAHRWWTYR